MEIESRDFLNTPPLKTVRFGGSVVETLSKYTQGDMSDYELLKYQLTDPNIKDAQIITWLQEFRNCVSQLTKEHEQLIYSILRLPWLGRSQAVADEYMCFLSNLVSAQTLYLCACLNMLVSHFTPKRVTISEGGVDISDSEDEDDDLPRMFQHCHQALQLITKYVPCTSQFLLPILQDNFPFVQKSSRTLECYVHNLLRMSLYIPSIRADVLEIIVGQMLKLDVGVSRSDMEDAEGKAASSRDSSAEEALFEMDEDFPSDQPCSLGTMAHPVAERLDALMSVMLAYIKDVCHVDGTLHMDRTKELYRDFLKVFDKLILPTHACSHIQYLLFYLCSFKLTLAEAFLDNLWRILQNPTQPAVLRQAAAGYMGSLLARAKFIPVLTVRACLDLLISWIHGYMDRGAGQDCCDLNLHGAFYAACQAVFYTLIFRHTAILAGNMKKGVEYLESLNLEKIVMCHLNPLKVCLPVVTSMFAAITRKYQLVFCYTIMERNKRQWLPVVRSSTGGHSVSTNTNTLDSFFPFDPCLLKRTAQMILPLYQVWESDHSQLIQQASREGDYDFLQGETPQGDGITGMTPKSWDSCGPCSVGSPPVCFQKHL
ncbi:RNA polymerase I-specific transcription initiation factor RRN3 [Nerophis lumbriciformis]|uniref:RNA polymerase I-specific transcription initiation factor RRN3 n=1 Tax=Nerophis lumbriciformis TaxID=546530 RepID=UPI003BA98C9B